MIRKLSTIILFCLLVAGISRAQDSVKVLEGILQEKPDDIGTLIKLGRIYHSQGAAGNKDAIDKGFTCFDKVLQIDPSNAIALAYRGSLWTIRARDAWWPFTKMSNVDKGIDELDKAAELAPNDITVRLVRGINSVQLPSMFRRLATALKDFNYLLNDARFSKFDPHLQSTIFCWAGIAYKNDGQTDKAKELLEKAISTDPNSDMAHKAENELKQKS